MEFLVVSIGPTNILDINVECQMQNGAVATFYKEQFFKMKVQLAMVMIANAILLAVIEVFIGKWANKTCQTLVLSGTISMGMAGGSVILAMLCSFVTYGIFDELEGRRNNMLFAVLSLMAGGGISSIVVEFLQIADFVKNEGRRTTRRTVTNQAAAENKVSLYLETAVKMRGAVQTDEIDNIKKFVQNFDGFCLKKDSDKR